ncbi:hypothetical protein [Laspinema sp. D2d]|nr:hypothetical protein [Laspinema sp. D2d]
MSQNRAIASPLLPPGDRRNFTLKTGNFHGCPGDFPGPNPS